MTNIRSAPPPPVRVVHSHPVWLPQTQPWLYNLVHHLPESSVRSDIVCERAENLEQFRLPRIHVLYGRRGGRLWNRIRNHRLLQAWHSRAFSRFLVTKSREVGAQVVHSHFGNIGWQDLAAVRAIKARHVVSFYGFEIGRLPKAEPIWRERYAELFAQVDLVTTQGPYMAQSVVDLGCPRHKMRIHALGIETGQIRYVPRRWTPGTPFRVLIAAGFVEKKGIPSAVAALGRIKGEVPLDITIIGNARGDRASRHEKQRIMEAIAAAGLESHVRLLGFQPHARMLEEAYQHHVFLSPSVTAADGDSEGGTVLAIIEMAATGLPVVSTRHCDIPALIEDRRTGMLAEERDIDGIAGCLRWLIEHPDQWRTITDAARKRVDRQYNAAVQATELAALYAELVSP